MSANTIIVQMDDADAETLWDNSTEWGEAWREQERDGRFGIHNYPTQPYGDLYGFTWAYWTASASSMILLRSFIAARGLDYAVLTDEAEGGYVLVTDWASPTWAR